MNRNKCNVVMFPTNGKANINELGLSINNVLNIVKNEDWKTIYNPTKQHLYITSDEEIKKGFLGWVFKKSTNTIEVAYDIDGAYINGDFKSDYKKIIATTDVSLGIALIPQQFINYFIEQYNKNNLIKEVLVEYEVDYSVKCYESVESCKRFPHNKVDCDECHKAIYKLKINSDNTINIKPIKDNWNREEVISLLKSMPNFFNGSIGRQIELRNKWIEENL